MKDFKIEAGDLVKLRDDLIVGKSYGCSTYVHNMKFKGFKKVEKICEIYGEKVASINNNYYSKEMIAEVKRPIKYETIYKREELILDEKEKEYLGNVIRPFRNSVKCIVKRFNFAEEYIVIKLNDGEIFLPDFKKDTMYKNMKLNREYTLEELEL